MAEASNLSSGWALRALPAITFLVGVALGGVFVGVGLDGDGLGGDSQSTGTTTDPTGSGTTSDTSIVIPAACSQAADTVTEAVDLIRDGAASVRDFQPKQLIEVLDALEVLDPKLQRLAQQCSAVDVIPASPTQTDLSPTPGSPTPTE